MEILQTKQMKSIDQIRNIYNWTTRSTSTPTTSACRRRFSENDSYNSSQFESEIDCWNNEDAMRNEVESYVFTF